MTYRTIQGTFSAEGLRFAIVASRFNEFVTERLLDGALDALRRHGASDEAITVVRTPGSWEMPLAVKRLAASKNYDAVIAVGAVIRGGTPHFEYVAAEVTKGLAQASLESGVPVSFGVLTTDSIEQAIERAGSKGGNKGFDAAMAAVEMVNLLKSADEVG